MEIGALDLRLPAKHAALEGDQDTIPYPPSPTLTDAERCHYTLMSPTDPGLHKAHPCLMFSAFPHPSSVTLFEEINNYQFSNEHKMDQVCTQVSGFFFLFLCIIFFNLLLSLCFKPLLFPFLGYLKITMTLTMPFWILKLCGAIPSPSKVITPMVLPMPI